MSFNTEAAERVRSYLNDVPDISVKEKKMFGGLAFMVNDKMCINISKNRLMCRFNPDRGEEILSKSGVDKMVMKEKVMRGYCYVHPEAYSTAEGLSFWIELCLDYNDQAKSSKKGRR